MARYFLFDGRLNCSFLHLNTRNANKFLNSFYFDGDISEDPKGPTYKAMTFMAKNFFNTANREGVSNEGPWWWQDPECEITEDFHPRREASAPAGPRGRSPKRGRRSVSDETGSKRKFPMPPPEVRDRGQPIQDDEVVSILKRIRRDDRLSREYSAIDFHNMATALMRLHSSGTIEDDLKDLDGAGACPEWFEFLRKCSWVNFARAYQLDRINPSMNNLLSYSIQGRDCRSINQAIGKELIAYIDMACLYHVDSQEISRVRAMVTDGRTVKSTPCDWHESPQGCRFGSNCSHVHVNRTDVSSRAPQGRSRGAGSSSSSSRPPRSSAYMGY